MVELTAWSRSSHLMGEPDCVPSNEERYLHLSIMNVLRHTSRQSIKMVFINACPVVVGIYVT